MNANKGYIGWSMSVRAGEAYENGEKPKSRWTKSEMLHEIASFVDDNNIDLSDNAKSYLGGLTKDELFRRFFYQSSWHHTGKFFNVTDFYALDEYEVEEFANNPTARTYEIVYRLGNHEVKCRHVFNTIARAERYLNSRGFIKSVYTFIRGNFTASINHFYTAI